MVTPSLSTLNAALLARRMVRVKHKKFGTLPTDEYIFRWVVAMTNPEVIDQRYVYSVTVDYRDTQERGNVRQS